MRRTVLGGILTLVFLLAACAEQPTEIPSQPDPPTPSELIGGPVGCTLNDLLDLTKAILPPSPQLNAIITLLKALPVKPPPRFMAALRRSVFRIIDLVSKAYEAGKLKDSPDTPANVLAFIQGMYCFAEMPAPTFSTPTGPIDPDEFAFAVISSTSGETEVLPNSEQGGLVFQAATLPDNVPFVTVTLYRLPDGPPGPLLTTLNQFPLFYEFSVSPHVEFTKLVFAGICLADLFPQSSSLRLAHNVSDDWGDVRILPFINPDFLNCDNLPASPGPLGSFKRLGSLFGSYFLPTQLHATSSMLVTTGVGGALKRLSPFGSVDPNSNPADLEFNGEFDELSAPAGTAVTPAPSVVVKSMNGTPIANVPVDFAASEGSTVNGGSTATVLTNDDGIATVDSWVLGEDAGTYTLSATPRHVNQDPATQEGFPDPPYQPAAEFDPASLVFTATTTSANELGFVEGGDPGDIGEIFELDVRWNCNPSGECSQPRVVVESGFSGVEDVDVAVTLVPEEGSTGEFTDASTTLVTTGSNGVAIFDDLAITEAGTYMLAFSAVGIPSVTSGAFSVGVTPPTPASFGSGNWNYKQLSNFDPVPGIWTTITPTAADGWSMGSAPFGVVTTCNLAPPSTPWTLNTTMLLRRDVLIPANTISATIDILIDNDVHVFVNGWDVSTGLIINEGCANLHPVSLIVPASTGPATAQAPLVAGQVNKIFIRGVDRGGQSYLDAKVTLTSD
jgi:hypothetical protein